MRYSAPSPIHSSFTGREVRHFTNFDAKKLKRMEDFEQLQKLGLFTGDSLRKISYAQDSLQPTVTTASIPTPIQFLQTWTPGVVYIATAPRKIDEVVGIATVGRWADQQIITRVVEVTGSAVPYGDLQNIPLADWNPNYVARTVVQFEQGMGVDILEEERAALAGFNVAEDKRQGAILALEIARNSTGFFGYNSGNNNTYGFLNDPNELNYTTVAVGASTHTFWYTKTLLEITNDIRTMIATLRTQSNDLINPRNVPLTLALATAVVDYLTTISDLGYSVLKWLSDTYPNIRIVSAPELDAASGGLNVGYLFADRLIDMSSDGGQTFVQNVPSKFQMLGIERKAKGYIEDMSNATSGVTCKRPFALTRWNGL